jgi:PII-like signaling protein
MAVPSTPARRVQVFVGEADHVGRKPRFLAILEYLRREGAAGATVTRGVAGFGVHSRIHTASILDLSADLPTVGTAAAADAPRTDPRTHQPAEHE